jgi:hypothetical protein
MIQTRRNLTKGRLALREISRIEQLGRSVLASSFEKYEPEVNPIRRLCESVRARPQVFEASARGSTRLAVSANALQ